MVVILRGLKKGEARGAEQEIIELNNGGVPYPYKSKTIDNIQNSTAPYRLVYFTRKAVGQAVLNSQYPNWKMLFIGDLTYRNGMKFLGNEYYVEPNCGYK